MTPPAYLSVVTLESFDYPVAFMQMASGVVGLLYAKRNRRLIQAKVDSGAYSADAGRKKQRMYFFACVGVLICGLVVFLISWSERH